MLLNVHTPMHACTHICMHACTCRYIKTFIYLPSYIKIKASALYDIEFQESDEWPGRTEVKQGKFVEYIFSAKGYFRETNKSQNINPILQPLSSPLVSYRSRLKAYQLVFSG